MKPTKVIYKKPREGKTTDLIKMCAKNGGVIVSADSMRAKATYEMAKNMGYEIPMPITHRNLLDRYFGKGHINKIYIDDATELIDKIAQDARISEVEAIAIDDLPEKIEV